MDVFRAGRAGPSTGCRVTSHSASSEPVTPARGRRAMPLFSSRKKSSSADRTKEATAALQCEAEGDRVAATSVPPVDITLGATSMQFGDGEWSVVDGGATKAGEAAPVKSGVLIAGALAAASVDELRKLRDENSGLRGEVHAIPHCHPPTRPGQSSSPMALA